MLSLDNPRWNELQHAYGSASHIPDLLRQLKTFPTSSGTSEPWFSIWSALAHQGDVYSASFAAVPHVVETLATDPTKASSDFLFFPTWVEICRHRNPVAVPTDLEPAYSNAIARLHGLACLTIEKKRNDDSLLLSALAAIAVAKGSPELAATIIELTPDVVTDFRSWFESR